MSGAVSVWGCVPGGRACPHAMEEAQAGRAGRGRSPRSYTHTCLHTRMHTASELQRPTRARWPAANTSRRKGQWCVGPYGLCPIKLGWRFHTKPEPEPTRLGAHCGNGPRPPFLRKRGRARAQQPRKPRYYRHRWRALSPTVGTPRSHPTEDTSCVSLSLTLT